MHLVLEIQLAEVELVGQHARSLAVQGAVVVEHCGAALDRQRKRGLEKGDDRISGRDATMDVTP
jgi:hypothetical protein